MPKKVRLDKANIEDVLALTPVQEGMLFHYLKSSETSLYFEQLCLEISGNLDVDIFEQAWNVVIDSNEMLRTVFRWEKLINPTQVILKHHNLKIRYNDHTVCGEVKGQGNEELLARIKHKDRQDRFDLQEFPFRVTLYRIDKTKYEMIISNHHILYDGWSNGIILKEFFAAYDNLSKGKMPVKPVKKKFKEFVNWIKSQDKNKQEKFWEKYLAGFNTSTELSVKRAGGKEITGIGNLKIKLGRDLRVKLESFIRGNKSTLASLLYSSWAILLQRYNNCKDVIFGTTVSGRSAKIKDIENIVGLFINTLPLRVQSDSNEKIGDLLKNINEALQAREEYETTPLSDIKEYSQVGSSRELFDSILVLENYPLHTRLNREKGELSIDSFSIFEMTNYDLTVAITLTEEIEVNFIYNDELFDQEVIERISFHFTNILEDITENPDNELNKIEILSREEKKQLLFDFNHREADFTAIKTIQQLFVEQLERTPEYLAVAGNSEVRSWKRVSLTYRELDEESNLVARHLLEKGVVENQLVGIMVGRTLEMIIGILGILKTGCGYVPLNPKAPAIRNKFILDECNVRILLTGGQLSEILSHRKKKARFETGHYINHIIDLEEYLDDPRRTFTKSGICEHRKVSFSTSIAYVIFTSGSTGKPKGVPISHTNFCALMHWGYFHIGLGSKDRVVQNLSYYFDWSVWEIFITLTSGASLHMVSEEVMLNPGRYVDFINANKITALHITPTQFQTLTHSGRGFGSLKHLAIGAEKLTFELVQRAFALVNEDCRVYNMYGPTEATIMSAVLDIERGKEDYYKKLSSIPIGPPIANTDFFVLDKDLNISPLNVQGELYIGGDSLTRGYLNNPELTLDKFINSHSSSIIGSTLWLSEAPNDKCPMTNDRLYHTGDLARWLSDGTLEFVGRVDQQVKIRGFRIEPGEVENQLLLHEDVKEALAMVRQHENGENYLCAYVVAESMEPGAGLSPSNLREFLAHTLPDYMIPAYFVVLGKMPLNPNGKIDIKSLPEPRIGEMGKEYIAPRSAVEKTLVDIWAEVLGTDSGKIGIHDDFFELGGHSLKVTALMGRIHKRLNTEVPFTEIFVHPSVKELAAYITQKEESQFGEIHLAEEKEYYPLSSAQRRLFVLQQMDAAGTAYNISGIMEVEGLIQREKFEAVFRQIINRHESLRTSFQVVEEQPVQKIHDEVEFEIEYYDSGRKGNRETEFFKSFIRPFDLSRAPLMRVELIKVEDKKHILMVDMHHIISDGMSTEILVKEFTALYSGEKLPGINLHYKDHVEWEKHEKRSEYLQKKGEYWKQEFEGEIPVLDLPINYVRPSVQSFEGKSINFEIKKETHDALKSLALETGTTMYMVLLALYTILLYKLSSQEDIVIGTPTAGRQNTDLEKIIGMFVNTLALRNFPSGEKKFTDFLEEVKKKTLNAFENQEYPYEMLVEQVEVNRDVSLNPLFDTMFTLQSMDIRVKKMPGLNITPYPFQDIIGTSKFDITFYAEEKEAELQCIFEYSTRLFNASTIERFILYFKKIITLVIENPGKEIGEIEIITDSEKQQLLVEFNRTFSFFPGDRTIMELFEKQVEKTPERIAIVGSSQLAVVKGERTKKLIQLTYKKLNKKSNQLAWKLREKGIKPGTIVGLMVDRSIEMIIGLYGILKVGGGYMPIASDYPMERIQYILEESRSQLLLTQQKYMAAMAFDGEILDVEQETLYHQGKDSNVPYNGGPEDLVYVIYTSGSMGNPKGVPIKSKGFVNLVYWYVKEFGLNTADKFLLIAPVSFDLAQKNLFAPLITGGCLCLASHGLPDYDEFSDFVASEYQTVINCAPTVFYPFVEINAGDGFSKLKSLRYVFLGGESIQMDKLTPWLASEACGCEIVNTYGPTECTDVVSYYRIPGKRANWPKVIPIGKPVNNVTLYILDKRRKLLPVGVSGEVCIGGIGLAPGYCNNGELTREKFIQAPHLGQDLIYCTGDLGCWLSDGNIEFLGRMDHQVKIRGLRIELGEIECKLLKHDKIKEVVVTIIADENRGNYLCAYIVPFSAGHLDTWLVSNLKEYLSNYLPGYMIPAYFVEMETFPLTPSGKVDRKMLPQPESMTLKKAYAAPRTAAEKKLSSIWAEVLGIDRDCISIDANFFEMGGHSLKATVLIAKIHKEFHVKVSLVEIFKTPFIRGLAEFIKGSSKHKFFFINPAEQKGYYALSSAQKRLYVLQQMDEQGIGYNIPSVWTVEGNIDKDRLEDIFRRLIQRHESLRTSFHMINEKPVQQIHDDVEFEIEFHAPCVVRFASVIKNFIRPFDLSQAPLLRVGLVKENEQKHILMVDMHHIISDGMSMKILVEELTTLHAGKSLSRLRIHYKDYTVWQNGKKKDEAYLQQAEYWQEKFKDEVPLLELPTDFARPGVQSFEGSRINFSIGSEETQQLMELAVSSGTTLYMVLLSLFNVLLSMITNQEIFVIGTAVAARRHDDLKEIIGMFVNTLALINYPGSRKRFNRFLKEVNQQTLEAFENQDYPFEEMVERIKINRDPGRNPLFDVMFVLQNLDIEEIELSGPGLKPYEYENPTSKFDLTAIVHEGRQHIYFTFEYSTKLFKKETIRRFTNYFKRIISILVKEPGRRIGEIEIISDQEKNRILFAFNDTRRAYPSGEPVHRLFEEQVKKTPGAAVLVYCDSWVTYGELNSRANQLAHVLRGKVVKPDTVVAIMVKPGIEMISGILAILKAGAAYLPIDPGYPAVRITYMIEDTGSYLLLTQKELKQKHGNTCEIIDLEDGGLYKDNRENLENIDVKPNNLAYIIYTSGSTGKPKGVLIEQQSLSNLCHWHNDRYLVTSNDRAFKYASFGFDASVWEIFPYLVAGASIYILNDDIKSDIHRLNNYFEIHQISIGFLPTQFCEQFVDIPNRSLRVLLTGGDKLKRFVQRNYQLANNYGPTENTVVSTSFNVKQGYINIPIGQPISNNQVYILNKNGKLQPIGIPGELVISGLQLGRGYLNNPELTAERFILTTKSQRHKDVYFSWCLDASVAKIYKTGDVARWLPNGNIEFLGRIDAQVKIRGFRIECGEIERCLLSQDSVKQAVVLTKDDDKKEKYLCAYIVTESEVPVSKLREFLSSRLPGYMIPSYFVKVDKISLTPSGKVDRSALPEPGIVAAADQYRAPRDGIEEKLAALWADILNIEKDTISIDSDFFALGGHSLKATLLISKIHKTFNVSVSLTMIFKNPCIRGLAAYIKEAAKDKYISIESVERKEYYTLSSAQGRLYVLQQMDEQGIGYNIPSLWNVEGNIDKDRLEDTFRQLIRRHESLRTSFHLVNDEPVQRIHDDMEFEIEYHDAERKGERHAPCAMRFASTIKNFIRPFVLSQAPLLRVGLVVLEREKYLLLVDMHHIISDGTSVNILVNDFMAFYRGKVLPELRIQYKDFSEWRNRNQQAAFIKQQEGFWVNEFECEIPVLELPADYTRPLVQSFEGSSVTFEIGAEETRALKHHALENDATLFMILLDIIYILLYKLSGQEDIVIGTPIAGRRHSDLQPVIGMFVNTLPLRNFIAREKSFTAFLEDLRGRTLKAYENQEYSLEELVEVLEVTRDVSRNPLFDVLFVLQNMESSSINQLPGLKITPHPYEHETSKFDLNISSIEMGEELFFSVKYCTKLFKKETIIKFTNYLKKIVSLISRTPGRKISEIEIITGEEKARVLFDFNKTKTEYPKDKVIHELFEERVERTPDKVAVVGAKLLAANKKEPLGQLLNTPGDNISLTYNEINEKSNQLGRILREKGIKPGSIVAIMAVPSVKVIIGITAILKTGGTYLPIEPGSPQKKIDYMLMDTQTHIILTQDFFMDSLPDSGELINIEDNAIYKGDPTNLKRACTPGDIVYTIYTSGTSGKSKGVLVKNENLVNYVSWFLKITNLTKKDKAMLISSFAFDLGYTAIYPSILAGGELHMIPQEVYLSPEVLLNYIKDNRITYLKLTPSLFSVIVSSSHFLKENLVSLRLVVLGGESINTRDVEHAHRVCNHLQIMNHYGPTETTIGSIARFIDFKQFEEYKRKPTIGKPINNTEIYILDEKLIPVPVGITAELCIGGDGVSRGYLNQVELTYHKFIAHPGREENRLYCTGDLAQWLPDGNIEFLGRIDHQVKIRGYRVELGDIESQLLTHHAIKEAVVVLREKKQGDQKYLCSYFVSDLNLPESLLREHLVERLPDHMIPSYFVRLEKIPTTPNGKLDKKALPAPEIKKGEDHLPPGDKVEEKMVEIWAEVLSLEKDKIGINDNFFQLGGHSLKAILLVSRIHKELNVKVPLTKVFQTSSIRGLAEFIKGAEEYKFFSLEKAEKKEYYPLSSSQMRLYILQQMVPETTGYNMPTVMMMKGELDRDKFEKTFRKVIERHESLRTSFEIVNSEPVQRIYGEVEFEVEFYDTEREAQSTECKEERNAPGAVRFTSTIKNFIRPFDLSHAPLLRVGLLPASCSLPSASSILMLDIHHIISDGISNNLLINDFMALYEDKVLPDLRIQYKDFSEWQVRTQQGESIKHQEEYWLKEFAGELPVLNLPVDYVRPVVQNFEGTALEFELGKEDTLALKSLAYEQGATLYMILLSLYTIFLSKITNQEDIVVGTPVAGRRHAELEDIIGVFVNTLALRNFPRPGQTFARFLEEVKKRTLESFAHQDYPYEDLVEAVVVQRDTSRNPLFDTMFVMHNIGVTELEIPGMKLSRYNYETRISKFDLSLYSMESNEKLVFSFEYSTKLFKSETVERFIEYFVNIIHEVIENSQKVISDLEFITEEEKMRILFAFNDTEREYPKNKTIQRLFEEQVERTPDNIAVIGSCLGAIDESTHQMTYRELDEKSSRLAQLLREKGIEVNRIAAIMVDRSNEMVVGIMGILKSGGAYLPIDPGYPQERIHYILSDSGAEMLLTDDVKARDRFKTSPYNELDIITIQDVVCRGGSVCSSETNVGVRDVVPLHLHIPPTSTTCLAYIIYTSGSTGNPKGVIVEHASAVNLLYAIQSEYPLGESDTYLLKTTYIFDVSVTELFGWYMGGGRVAVLEKDGHKDPRVIVDSIERNKVSHINFVPSMLNAFIEYVSGENRSRLSSLKYIFLAGEALLPELVKKFKDLNTTITIENIYGPTENTVYAGNYSISEWNGTGSVPIGKPLPNINLYILNRYNHLQPLGVVGELCISGVGLSRGYLNRPELTAEKFIYFAHDFHEYKHINPKLITQNSKLYRTGDLVKWLPDGNIEFIGRLDHQVKIRGFRIELGEIENRLLQHEEIEDTVVLAKQIAKRRPESEYQLYAYIVSGKTFTVPELREFLSNELPDYMLPSHFVQVKKIPLTPNGKVDRKILETYGTELGSGVEYVAPRNSFEEEITDIWKEELNVDKIGIYDNFFELGGNSMNIVKVSNRLKEITDKTISVMTMFRYPTVHLLSQYVSQENIENTFSDNKIEESVQMMEDTALMFLEEDDE